MVTGAVVLWTLPGLSEEKAPEENGAPAEEKEKEEDKDPLEAAREKLTKKFDEVRKSSERSDGLLPFWRDQRDGGVYLELSKEHLDRDYIYFSHTVNGVVAARHFRGRYGDSRIVRFQRRFDRVDVVAVNTSFYFDPESALSRAAEANISEAMLVSAPIVAEDFEAGTVLIEADEMFLKELMEQVKPSDPKEEGGGDRFKLGELSGERTHFTKTSAYPENSVFRVLYVYQNLRPKNRGGEDVTDARFVGIEVQHTFLEAPENGYRPRFDDPRVGYFMTKVTDLTSTSNVPYRDVIHRWHLEPKEAGAEVSEPVEPLVWWMENTTPVELRETIREAALLWNEAFRSAGWENALEIRQQPDDADWEADDVRYHVLRWTSSPNPPFGGYGPSFVDPRTGQILGADIMLEWTFIANRVRYRKVFDSEAFEALLPGQQTCFLNHFVQQGISLGRVALQSPTKLLGDEADAKMVKEALHYLVLHEIGHTLGLAHNFRASTLLKPEELHDAGVTEARGVAASVMDYPAINVAPEGQPQALYYNVRPGIYDHWAIEYGYSREAAGAEAEEERLRAILDRSTEPGLAFGNDADDMRWPGKGIDPRIMTGDLSSDPVAYAEARLELVGSLMKGLLERASEEGKSYQTVRDDWETLVGEYGRQLSVISRQVGGVWVNRAFAGQPGATAETDAPLTPVPAEEQRRALAALERYAWSEGAFPVQPELFAHLQLQRRGWEFEPDGEDPKLLQRFEGLQDQVLAHVFHPNTVKRVLNSSLYGDGLSFAGILDELQGGIFDLPWQARESLVRESLQRRYLERLIDLAGLEGKSEVPHPAQILAFDRVEALKDALAGAEDAQGRFLRRRIEEALAVD